MSSNRSLGFADDILKQIEDTQSFLLGCKWAQSGQDFFQAVAEFLAKTLQVDYVCIDELLDGGLAAQTVAIYFDGSFEDNVKYTLRDTPCGEVVGDKVCFFPAGVRHLFPKDEVLQEMVAESYAGITLYGTTGLPIGLIAIIGRRPMTDMKLTEFVLKLVSIRAASELVHRKVEDELRKKDERLHAILESAIEGFMITDMEGRFLEVNKAYCIMSGYTLQELLTMKISDVEYIEKPEETLAHIQKIQTLGEDRFESKHKRKDGFIYDVEVNVQYRPFDGGQFVTFIHDVSKHKEAEREIIRAKEDWEQTFNTIPDLIAIIDNNHRIVRANKSMSERIGMREGQCSGFQCFKVMHNLDHSPEFCPHSKLMRDGNMHEVELFEKHLNGDFLVTTTPLANSKGEIIGSVHVARDITERRKAEESLRQSEERYKSMFEGTLSVMLLLNPDTGEIVDANMAACNFYGWSYTELTGKRVSDLNTLPQEETIKVMQKAKNSQNNHFVFKHRLASSEIRDVEVYSSPLKFNDATYLLSLIHDITESKRMEKELRESEFFFRESQRAAFIGSYKTDFTHGHWESSEVLDKIFGIDKSYDRSIDNWVAIVHPDDQVMMSDYLTENVFKNRETFNKEYRIVRKSDGQERWVHGLGSIGFDEKGEVISMVGTIQDITDRKEAEECLKQSEDKFRRLVFDMSVGVLLQGPDTEVLLSNRKALELLGLTEIQLLGKTSSVVFGNAIHEDGSAFPGEAHPVQQAIATRKAVTDVVMGVYRPATNDRVWLLVNAVPHFNSDQSVKKVVCTFIDITNLKRIENELRESEQRLKFHFENSPLAIVEWDSDFIVKQWSLEAEHIFGWEKEDILGKPIHSLNLIYEEDIPIVANTIVRLTGGSEQTVVSENRNVKKSGEIIDAVWYNSVLLDENGAMISVISLVQDVTQQKKAEDALRKSEEKLQTIYSSMNEGLAIHDIIYENGKAVDYLISDINPAFEKLTGFKRSDALGSKASELYGIGIAPYLDIYASVASGGPSEFFETYFPPLDKYFSISVFSPEMGKFATVFNDISERRRRDELLHKHNLIMSALNKSSQAMVYSSDELLYMNQVCNIVVEDCGFAMVWIGLAEDDEKKSVRPVASAGFEEGYLETLKISWGDNERGRGPTGTAIRTGTISMCWDMGNDPSFELWREEALKRGYASSVVFPLISDERVFGAISIYSREANPFDKQEITLLSELAADLSHGIKAIRLREAQKLAEKALLQSHDKLESLVRERTRELQNTNEALKREIKIRKQQERSIVLAEEKYRTVADHTYNWETWVGNHGKYIYVSPSCYTITGYTVDEFMNDPLLTINIAHPEDREAIRRHYYEELKGSTATWSLDFRIIHKNGEVRWIGHSCRPIFNSDGKWIGQRASNRDITEQKITELLMISTQQQLRALTHKLDAIAEDERTRIAREIHDELGHLLTALKYDIESLTEKVDLSTPAIVSEFDGILSIIDALIDSVRKISTELRPGVLDHLGLLPAIEWQIRQFQMRTKINCECDIRDTGGSLTKNETTILFRIVQEILTNVARHSKATKLTILLDKNENEFLLKAKDDGVGFEWKENYFINSLGLMGMRERAMSIGGEIKIESAVGQGTTVTFSLKAAVRSENENYVII